MEKIKALTSLRFIAAAVVFLHHYLIYDGYRHLGAEGFWDIAHSIPGVLILEMRYGVTLFFVLSGFLLLVRYYESIFRRTSFGVYWVKRFARIMPLYWFLLAIMFCYYLYTERSVSDFGVYVTLTQGFFSYFKFQAIGTAWSLTVEECFYLMLPFMILGLRFMWPEKAFSWLKAGFAVLFLSFVCYVLFKLGERIHDKEVWEYGGFMAEKSDVRLYTIFGRMGDFAIGMGFGLLYLKTKNSILNKGWLMDLAMLASVAGVLATCYYIFMYLGNGPSFDNLARATGIRLNLINAFLSGVIIYACCSPVSLISRLLSWRPLEYLGEISFALYLIHYNIISFHLYDVARDQNWGFIVSAVMIYAVLTVLSILCYEVVERPAQHLILERAGVLHRSVRRPTLLRLLGMERRSFPRDADPEWVEQRRLKSRRSKDVSST